VHLPRKTWGVARRELKIEALAIPISEVKTNKRCKHQLSGKLLIIYYLWLWESLRLDCLFVLCDGDGDRISSEDFVVTLLLISLYW
jgi:hypothetical protein